MPRSESTTLAQIDDIAAQALDSTAQASEPHEVISVCSVLKNISSSGYHKIVSWVAKPL